MSYMHIDQNKCIGCGECVADCPFGVLRLEPVGETNANKAIIGPGCRLCSTCEMACEQEAITFVSGKGTGTVKEAEDFHF